MLLLFLWALATYGCFTYGFLFYKTTGLWRFREPAEPVQGSDFVLAGLCLLVAYVQIASLFFPANSNLTAVWLAGAVLITFRYSDQVRTYGRQFFQKQRLVPVFGLLVLTVLLYSTLSPANADSGLYHLPSIRWYERFRVVPGLGNLHGRLAFNSSFFVASAAFGLTDLVGQTLFPLNGFVFLLVSWRLLNQAHSRGPYRWPAFAILLLILYYLIRQVYSPTPDLWATLLPVAVFLIWLEIKPVFSFRLVLLVMLVSLSLTVKLATIPVALSLVTVAWAVRRKLTAGQWGLLGSIGLCLVVPWLVRNVILSGYLLYPYPALDLFSFDWKIPADRVQFEKDFVAFWAKFRIHEAYYQPDLLNTPATEWIPRWLFHPEHYALNKPIWALAVVSPVVAVSHFFSPRRKAAFRPLNLPYGVALAGFLFWFLSAPEFRFGYAFIWLTALLPWQPVVSGPVRGRMGNRVVNGLVTGASLILIGYFGNRYLVGERFPVERYAVLPRPLTYTDKGTRQAMFIERETRSGMLVLTPRAAPLEQSCFNEEMPCSPYYYPDLEMRGRTLADGFRSSRQRASRNL
ncbi:LIC_10190 family membrane protein [Larkinella soli]